MKSFNRIRCLNQAVCDVIDNYNLNDIIVADVGADHGYLAELLSRNKKIKKIYATDISQKCLDKTNELISRCKLEKIETKLGDGLDAVDVVDVAVVAGMGGYEMINMLSNQNITINNQRKCSIFVLQPSRNAADLRSYLIDENVAIIQDFIVKSGGKFYPIIIVDLNKHAGIEKSVFNLYFGHGNNAQDPVFIEYLKDVISRLGVLKYLNKADKQDEVNVKIEIYELAKKIIENYKGD